MGETGVFVVPNYEVVFIVHICKLNRGFFIYLASIPMLVRNALLMLVIFEIAEFDFAAKRDGALNGIDVVEHRLILALDAAFDMHLFTQVFVHVSAAEFAYAFDE